MKTESSHSTPGSVEYTIPHQDKGELRLTRRGKVAAWMAGVALSAGSMLGLAHHNGDADFSKEQHSVTVHQGDTVWDLANTIEGVGKVNKQDAVTEIQERSPDFDDGVHPGDVANIPDRVE